METLSVQQGGISVSVQRDSAEEPQVNKMERLRGRGEEMGGEGRRGGRVVVGEWRV